MTQKAAPSSVQNPPPPIAADSLESLEKELEANEPDGDRRKLMTGMMSGFASLKETAGGRAFIHQIRNLTDEERKSLRRPEFHAEYQERLARFYEQGKDEELLEMLFLIGGRWELSKRQVASIVGRAARKRVARAIRKSAIPGGPAGVAAKKAARHSKTLAPLSSEEKARVARAMKFSLPRFALAVDALRESDLTGFATLSTEGYFPMLALALNPPPPGEPYGKKNRSEILLPTDRKHCAAPGCEKVISNCAFLKLRTPFS
ncbi:MAG: hypothetical protein ACYDFT_06370 [Thermoplasmata archaeon]